MAAGNTYTQIANVTVTNTSTITANFSSIPSTYTDLVLICSLTAKSASGETMLIRVNSDNASNYSSTRLIGDGSTATSNRVSSNSYATISGGSTGTADSMIIVNLMNYGNTTTYKTFLSRFSQAANETDTAVSLWRSTAAINAITIQGTIGYLGNGSTFNLYGIAAA